MKVEKDCRHYSSHRDDPARETLDASDTIERRTEITVTGRVLIAMPAQSLAHNKDIIELTLGMQFIADMPPATFAGVLVDEVRGAGDRPLVGVSLRATDIADLCLCHLHLLFGARGMLLLRKMLLAEATSAIWASSKRLFTTFMTTASGIKCALATFRFGRIKHVLFPQSDNEIVDIFYYKTRIKLTSSALFLHKAVLRRAYDLRQSCEKGYDGIRFSMAKNLSIPGR
jgi:hypothetical protein